jgi:3-oxoadipate enol-lactonase
MTIWHGEAGSGDPVVLLHSGVADSGMWDGQWDALAERFRVIKVDYRGYGRTPFEAAEPYSDAADVAEVLAELGVTRAALVASSYGCLVAMALGHLAERLVLLNPPGDLPFEMEAFEEEEGRLLELGDVAAATELNVRTWLGPEASPEAAKRLAAMQEHAFTVQLAADPEPTRLPPSFTLAEIQAPALVVVGAHDLPYFQASARHVAATLPHASLVELGWAGHLPALERPDEVTGLLLDFL